MDRSFPSNPTGLGKLNVVVVASESFGAEFSKLYGSQRDWTPQFDSYARQGIWFRHMYASGTRTVRGLEAIATSLPPIPSVSVLRRPGNEGIANWGSVMRQHGYQTSFLYGGYGYFDNMNYFFGHNGFEVRDREQIPKPVRFENIWGVADEDLFDSALHYYDDAAKSGQAILLDHHDDVEPQAVHVPRGCARREAEGRRPRIRRALCGLTRRATSCARRKKHAWFDNTLFIIVADHGARVYGREEIPLKSYEIPMLFYSPKHMRPGQVDTLTTQIDIAPTVLGLLGLPLSRPVLRRGRAAFAPRRAGWRSSATTTTWRCTRTGSWRSWGSNKSVQNVYYDPATDSYRPAPPNAPLNDLAVAYYQTAFELFRERRYN